MAIIKATFYSDAGEVIETRCISDGGAERENELTAGEAIRLAERLLHVLGIREWKVEVYPRLTLDGINYRGTCWYPKRTISFYEQAGGLCLNTVVHEVAHVLQPDGGHGKHHDDSMASIRSLAERLLVGIRAE